MKKLVISERGRMVRLPNGKTVRSPVSCFINDSEAGSVEAMMRNQAITKYMIEESSDEEYRKYIEKITSKVKKRPSLGGGKDVNMNLKIGGK